MAITVRNVRNLVSIDLQASCHHIVRHVTGGVALPAATGWLPRANKENRYR